MNQLSDRKTLEPGEPPPAAAAYDADFALWSQRQAQLLRQGHLNELDRENLIEELEAMGSSQREALESRLVVLLTHLLKCQFQPQHKSSSWIGTLHEQRTRIAILIKHSPSLALLVVAYADEAYPQPYDKRQARPD